uniref:Ig-like domain-containing protein n=1 Tax=Naja naja TaxID=35670 RepID=A0A8C6Y0Z9_NAJNA
MKQSWDNPSEILYGVRGSPSESWVQGRFLLRWLNSGRGGGIFQRWERGQEEDLGAMWLYCCSFPFAFPLLGASSHSLKYFYTAISEPSQGLPQFVTVGYLDGQVFVYYDSHTQKKQPRVSWIEKYVGKEDPQYWDRETQISRGNEEAFRRPLNHPSVSLSGLHTLQRMFGCELRRDGSKGGFIQDGYNGRTFLTFDKETLTWVAPIPKAQITKRRWDADTVSNQRKKAYLEEICIEWLERYLSYGKETLLRTEPPVVTMSSKSEVEDGMEAHVCRLDGFYPSEIDASWTRDGEVWVEETFHGFLAPNTDGTYHYWLSIWINPKERGRYRCHVEHDGLQEPLDLALEGEAAGRERLGSLAAYLNFHPLVFPVFEVGAAAGTRP